MSTTEVLAPERLVWEPGNGTRYELVVTPNPGRVFGYGENTVTVIGPFPDKINAAVLYAESPVRWEDVSEKMDLNEHDASMVALMVAHILGTKAYPTTASWFKVKNPIA